MKVDLETFDLSELGCKFDSILLEPPLHEYQRAQGMVFDKYWDWDEVSDSKQEVLEWIIDSGPCF